MHPISRTAVAGAALAMMAFGAQAVALVAINSQTELTVIDTNNVGAATHISITGLAADEGLVGIDTRPSNGLIYGVSTANLRADARRPGGCDQPGAPPFTLTFSAEVQR